MQITSRPFCDNVTMCKRVTSEEHAFNVFNSLSFTKKHVILAINIIISQIALSIRSSLSGTGFYVMRSVKTGGW